LDLDLGASASPFRRSDINNLHGIVLGVIGMKKIHEENDVLAARQQEPV
jgi:hypothetical protein